MGEVFSFWRVDLDARLCRKPGLCLGILQCSIGFCSVLDIWYWRCNGFVEWLSALCGIRTGGLGSSVLDLSIGWFCWEAVFQGVLLLLVGGLLVGMRILRLGFSQVLISLWFGAVLSGKGQQFNRRIGCGLGIERSFESFFSSCFRISVVMRSLSRGGAFFGFNVSLLLCRSPLARMFSLLIESLLPAVGCLLSWGGEEYTCKYSTVWLFHDCFLPFCLESPGSNLWVMHVAGWWPLVVCASSRFI